MADTSNQAFTANTSSFSGIGEFPLAHASPGWQQRGCRTAGKCERGIEMSITLTFPRQKKTNKENLLEKKNVQQS